jgi:hypothetical protein
MDTNIKRLHYFHADANALGGQLERPTEQVIPVQAPISLPPVGGYASSRVDGFHVKGILSFDSAYTQVAGNLSKKEGGGWTTLMTAAVEGLNVLDVVTADRVVAQISTEHPLNGYLPRVTLLGTRFENLRIGGHKIDVVVDLDLFGLEDGKGYPPAPYIEDKEFLKRVGGQAGPATSRNSQGIEKGFVACSVVKQAPGDFNGTSYGNVLEVPEFGKIFLGELLVDRESFHLIMIRLELGCIAQGSISVAAAKSNGSTYP